jgi:hypothetical protein
MFKKTPTKPIPYASTEIPVENSVLDVKQLLKAHGITGIQETEIDGETEIRFIYKRDDLSIPFKIKPPRIMSKKKTWSKKLGRYEVVEVPMLAQAWRLVYWYMEIKLKAVQYGIASLEQEFLSQMVTGSEETVGDLIVAKLERDKVLYLEGPVQESSPRKVIEAGYQVKP